MYLKRNRVQKYLVLLQNLPSINFVLPFLWNSFPNMSSPSVSPFVLRLHFYLLKKKLKKLLNINFILSWYSFARSLFLKKKQNMRIWIDIIAVAPPFFAGEKHIEITGLRSRQNFFPCLLKQKIMNLTGRIFLYSKCQLHFLPIFFQEKVTIFLSIPTKALTPSVHFSRKNGSIFLATPLIIINIMVAKQ